MTQRSAKKGPAGTGAKKSTPKPVKSNAKPQNQPEAQKEVEAPAAENTVSQVNNVKAEDQVKDKQSDGSSVTQQSQKLESENTPKEEESLKEAFEEEDKGERLDLDDNELEYEGEEDHDDKGEHGEEHDVEDEEEVDEGDVVEGEGGMADVEDGEEDDEEGRHGDDEEEHVDLEDQEEHEEHHDVVTERRKRKEFEIFVGGLDKDASEEDLRKVFGTVGEVTEIRLMMNPQTKKNKGFAFLRFATVEQAKKAAAELKHPVVNGKQCGVTPSHDNDTLFVGNICKTWTKEALREKLKNYGVDSYEDLTLVEDSNNEGFNRGFGFLEFSSRAEAMEAFKRLQRRDVRFGVDRLAKISFADSFIEPDDELMAEVRIVFIDGVPASWDEDRVKEYLKKYGEIEKIELARNMPSARRKDFGFVTFDSHDNAVKCAEAINNSELGEGDHKAKVRARLSRPHQRIRGRRLSRGDYGRGIPRGGRGLWSSLPPRRLPPRSGRGISGRGLPLPGRGLRRPVGLRDRRPSFSFSERERPLPQIKPYDRRPPLPSYPKGARRDYGRREEILHPRSSRGGEYASRAAIDRRSYREEYDVRDPIYSDIPARAPPRPASRRTYDDEGYNRRLERPPSYREGRSREYDSLSGSKRPYSTVDDDPRYSDPRPSRARLDYDVGSQYGEGYPERLGRTQLGNYNNSRSSYSSQDPLYTSRGMGYGSVNSSNGGVYSSGYGSDYMSRGPDVEGGSLSSLYSGRNLSGGGYMGSSGSGSYY